MLYGERAEYLRKRRGGAPLLVGDAAASKTTIIHKSTSPWSVLLVAVLLVALGMVIGTAIGSLAGYGHRLSPAEARFIDRVRAQAIDLDSMSSTDIDIRLGISAEVVTATGNILRLPQNPPPDLRWISQISGEPDGAGPSLPDRIAGLEAVVSVIASAPLAKREQLLDGFRIDAALTDEARSIVAALRHSKTSDPRAIGHLLDQILNLPPDQRRTLEAAGFPALPRQPERQAIYQRLPSVDDGAAALIWRIMSMPAGQRQTLVAIADALRWTTVNRVLGALRDGDRATVAAAHALPPACTADIPTSCSAIPR